MNHFTLDQKKRAVTELSALEKQLDQVLFARDDDDDDSFPWLKAGAGLAAGGGAAAGAYYGGKKLAARGNLINRSTPQTVPLQGPQGSAGAAPTVQPVGDRSFRVTPDIPERRFVLPGTTGKVVPGQSKGLLGDLATGTKAAAGEAKEGVSAMFKRLFGQFGKAAA